MVQEIKKRFNLREDTEIWFTDGSKIETEGYSRVGVGIYKENDEDGICCALENYA